jgi:recombination protein RecA
MPISDRDALSLFSAIVPAHEVAAPETLSFAAVAGRLSELSGSGDTAGLTMAFALALDAQRQGEIVAWITPQDSMFFPVDVAESGIDLDALVVVRTPDPVAAARSADRLARSGAFGLLVLDLGWDDALSLPALPLPALARLAGLAQKHHTAIVCVTRKAEHAPSLGSLISLRGCTHRERIAQDRFRCTLHAVKDKRRGPWVWEEICRGPVGLR